MPASRREFLAAAAGGLRRAASGRPNIILVVVDDQRYDAFSACGHGGMLSFLKTPNMDRLAAEGINFRNAFVTTSLCTPSRASILTGQYVHTHGVNALELDVRPGATIFPELLRKAGYETGFVGKWHLGRQSEEPDPAFDSWAAFRSQGVYFNPVLNVNGRRTATNGYVTDVLTDYAIDFVRRKRDRPFFLQLGHKAPHAPVTPPAHLEPLFSGIDVPYPPSYYENHDDKPPWYLNFHNHDFFHTQLHPRAQFQKYVKDYCRTLVSIDENLGRLLAALDETGLSGNTAIFYLSDNGHFLGEHQFYSKMIMYEEAIRIPLLVRFPERAPRGLRCDEMVLNVDLAPTILELAGSPVPREMEGRSFLPLLEGRRAPGWRKSFLYEYDDGWGLPPLEGVRTADGWQYTRYPDWEQLYYMPDDPCQMRNLARDARFAGRKKRLITELRRLGGGKPLTRGPSEYQRRSEPVHTAHPPNFNER